MSDWYQYRHWHVSAEMVEALERYAKAGVPLGGFLEAVVANDFQEACGRADDTNIANLPAFAAYVYNEMPARSHGSRKLYEAWLEMHADRRKAMSS